ncbi:MAG: TIGR03089 family protein [Micrococcaceae bacterium]
MVSLSSSGPAIARPGADLIAHVGASARPALIQYHRDGSRTELSGRVLVNWAAKTANLLDHHGIDTSGVAVLDLPLHWLSLAASLGISWDLAEIRYAAAEETVDADGVDGVNEAEMVFTTRPATWAQHPGELIVVTSLDEAPESPESRASLPDHAIDFDDEVASQADQHPGAAPDLITGTEGASARWAAAAPESARAFERGLIVAADRARLSATVISAVHEQWSRRCPVILVDGRTLNPEQAARLGDVERLGGAAH